MSQNVPDLATLRRLRPLAMFSNEQLETLSPRLEVKSARKNERLIHLGSAEETSLFVLNGEINMVARDGDTKSLAFTPDQELNPVAQLRPCLYDIYAKGPVEYLKIGNHLLTEFAHLTEHPAEDSGLDLIEEQVDDNPLTMHLFQDLMTDNVRLPSLPEVAQKIQQLYHEGDSDADQVAKILMVDPAISSKLIRIANSPVYSGVAATKTLQGAIVRLGMDTTYKQVMVYAINELFEGLSNGVARRMKYLWSHSRRVAAISRVLAKTTGLFDPEQAMLAGLTHDLGVIIIVEYLEEYGDGEPDRKAIDDAIDTMRPQITGMLMRKWNFADEIVKVAEECEHWFRNPRGEADLCDVVLIAQYHSLIGTDMLARVPPISTLPAMAKLKMGPAESIELVKQSNREIMEVEQMLN